MLECGIFYGIWISCRMWDFLGCVGHVGLCEISCGMCRTCWAVWNILGGVGHAGLCGISCGTWDILGCVGHAGRVV